HDLRTPISLIQTTNALLSSGEVDPAEYMASGFPEILENSCNMMMQLIDGLLDVNKIKLGSIGLDRRTFDLEELIDKVTRAFMPAAGTKDIGLEVDIPIAVPKIKADPLRIEQVLNNLISNALKFSPPGSQVVIGLKPHHSKV